MTRVNVIPPAELCDQHLIAEWREITRIPNCILSGKLSITDIPGAYTIRTASNPAGGKGHIKFFINKLLWLESRYDSVLQECLNRGFRVVSLWPADTDEFVRLNLWNDYVVTEQALLLNRTRIAERMPKVPRYSSN